MSLLQMALFNVEMDEFFEYDFHNSLENDFYYGLQDLQPQSFQDPFNIKGASDNDDQLF
ncbi:35222_t:CDS:2 [Gigaspora margarita]|uniref:35222_t:CDS:1 n=1 Tax=Gigaspora margarita TaxID=4874 RepID=A0ABN7VGL0_GIGMA|nr:35222_t:CDS:2 [Gigaspora margarita]